MRAETKPGRQTLRSREASGSSTHMGEPIQALREGSPPRPRGPRHGGKTSEIRSETDAALHSHLAISHAMT